MRKRTGTAKRPTDPNQLMHMLGEESTREKDAPSKDEISKLMALMGSRGGKVGGKRRAEKMTPEQRRDSASKAARARWGKN